MVILTLGNATAAPRTKEAAAAMIAQGWTLETGSIEDLESERQDDVAEICKELKGSPDLMEIFRKLVELDDEGLAEVIAFMDAIIAVNENAERLAQHSANSILASHRIR